MANKGRPIGRDGTGDDDNAFEFTPKDKYILELNHEGLSYRQISDRLKADHGIQLAKSSISRRLRELMQDPANGPLGTC